MNSNKQKKRRLYVGIVLVLAVCVFAVWTYRARLQHAFIPANNLGGSNGLIGNKDGGRVLSDRTQKPTSIDEKKSSRSTEFSGDTLKKVDVVEYVAAGGDVMLLASSRQEAEWLSKHGYPTPEDAKDAGALPLSTLKAYADDGSAKYAYLYAHKLMMRHGCAAPGGGLERSPCAQAFRTASILGSFPAMMQYPSFYANAVGDGSSQDTIRVNAWAKLAYVLGEPAAGGRAGVVPLNKKVSMAELNGIFGQVPYVWVYINDQRAKLGLPPLVPDPRPKRVVPPGANPGDVYSYVGS